MEFSKELLGTLATLTGLIAIFPYFIATIRQKVRPHMFSWVIWGSTTVIVFAAQLADGAGAGAWSMGVSGCITLLIAFIAFLYRTDNAITRLDWHFFITAMSALPLWYFTANPVWAVILLTGMDLFAYGPTIRKAWQFPYEESIYLFGVMILRNALSYAALEHYSLTTTLFVVITGIANIIVISIIILRRLQPSTQPNAKI